MPGRNDGRPGAASATDLLSIRDLSFGYDGTEVVRIPELSVASETITVLIGSNGCGKTTTFKLVNGLVGPYEGRIFLEGHEISGSRGRQVVRNRAVYVHQHPYIFRERVWANVAFALRARGTAAGDQSKRIGAALEAVGLMSLAQRRADTLSGGERQRVAIARALALEPGLLLLDEPTSNIDPQSVELIEKAVLAARSAGMTVMVSTHNLATAYRIGDRVIPMESGSFQPQRNNIYRGSVESAGDALARFSFSGGSLLAPEQDGEYTAALVPMDDVFLSQDEVISTARNHYWGTVAAVEPFSDHLLRVELDCGFPLAALVTGRAVEQIEIRVGKRLFAGFKSSAVRLY